MKLYRKIFIIFLAHSECRTVSLAAVASCRAAIDRDDNC